MTIWVTSDHHFSHKNILTFKTDGQLMRPGFDNIEQMNEFMIDRWNETVSTGDIIYHLGDVGFNKNELCKILPKLNGKKRLILGNHDNFKKSFYEAYFKKVGVSRQFGKVILTHIPIHIDLDDYHGYELNIHGHIHDRPSPTIKHYNVCVEQHDYRPVNLEEITKNCERFKL